MKEQEQEQEILDRIARSVGGDEEAVKAALGECGRLAFPCDDSSRMDDLLALVELLDEHPELQDLDQLEAFLGLMEDGR